MPTDLASLLREHGLNVTAQRLAVLRAASSHSQCTSEGVTEHARAETTEKSTSTAEKSDVRANRHEVPVHRRGPETHGRRRDDQPRLVAWPAEGRPPEPAFVEVRSDGRQFQLR